MMAKTVFEDMYHTGKPAAEIVKEKGLAQISDSSSIEKLVEDRIRIAFDYGKMGEVMNVVKKMELNVVKQHFEETAYLEVAIRKSETDDQLLRLKALLAKVSLEEAALMEEEVEGVEMKIF